jgi:hypothetical protein
MGYGEDMDHLAVVGAGQQAAMMGQANLALRQLGMAKVPSWMAATGSPQGVSTPAEELDFLPLRLVDFLNSGLAAVDHTDELDAQPHRPFRGERLILQATYVPAGGVGVRDALYQMIITPAMYVGAVQIGATQGSMPASAFAATAFGVRLSMPVAGQGTRIYVPFTFFGVGAGDRIVIGGGIFGRAVR